jgi:predicted metal-dependent hydrolase
MQLFVQLALDFLTGTEPVSKPSVLGTRGHDGPPAESMTTVFQPGTWHHPRGNRRVKLAGYEVTYEFSRGKRRTIGLSVGPEGLSVRAPRWTTVGEVEAFIHEKSAWVLDKLRASRERAGALERARMAWADGAEFDFLGRRVGLRLDPSHDFKQVGAGLSPGVDGAPATLWLGLANNASEAQIRDAAQAWLMRQAQQVFAESLQRFAPQLGVSYKRLRLSSASTRWGSASADGTIRLNWRLIHLKPEMIDYVVVHELSHLRHMDHSPQFWDVVASVLPDHVERRKALKQVALSA